MTKAEALKRIRESTGLSQRQFARKYKIPWRSISNWERGVNEPSDYFIVLLAYVVENQERAKVPYEVFADEPRWEFEDD